MLEFFRVNKRIIAGVIVAFLVITTVGGTIAWWQTRKTASRTVVKSGGDSIAWVGDMPVDRGRYTKTLDMILNQYQSANPTRPLGPEGVEMLEYRAFQQLVQNMILRAISDEKKVTLSSVEFNAALEGLYETYKVSGNREFREFLKTKNVPYDTFVADFRGDVTVRKFLSMLQSEIQVSDQDIINRYREVHARHILIPVNVTPTDSKSVSDEKEAAALSQAQSIVKRLEKGESFTVLARLYSLDPGSRSSGGDLGWIRTGMMVKPFEDAVFSLSKGEISRPIRTQFGYHIVQVLDTRELKRSKNLDVQKERNEIISEQFNRKVMELIQGYLSTHPLKVEHPNLAAIDAKIQNRFDDAVRYYQLSISRFPQNPVPDYLLGRLFVQMQRPTEAVKAFETSAVKVRLSPANDFAELHVALMQVNFMQKRTQDGLAQWDIAYNLATRNEGILPILQSAAQSAGDSTRENRAKRQLKAVQAMAALSQSPRANPPMLANPISK